MKRLSAALVLAALPAVSFTARPAIAQPPPGGARPAAELAAEGATAAGIAVGALTRLPASVQRVQDVVNEANFGPFEVSGSCTHCSAQFVFCWRHSTFRWGWSFGYGRLRDVLDSHYRNVQIVASQFEDRFAPVRAWMQDALPAITAQVEAASATVRDAGILRVDAPIDEIVDPELAVLRAIERTAASVRRGAEQLRPALSELAAFEEELTGALGGIAAVRAELQRTLDADQRSVDGDTTGWPCGAAGGREKFRGVRATAEGQLQKVMTADQTFVMSAAQAGEAVSAVLGVVLNLTSAADNVTDNLVTAAMAPAGALQRLRWSVAEAEWRELAAYARRNLAE